MSNLVGADVGELRELAATFNARAAQLKSIESQLNWRIHAAPWEGHDVSRFVQDWNTRHRRVILGASAAVTNAAQELLAHAEQQEQASTAGNTGVVVSVAALRREQEKQVHQDSGRAPDNWLSQFLTSAEVKIAGVGLAVAGVYKDSLDWVNKARRASVKPIQAFIRSNKAILTIAGKVGGVLGITGLFLSAAQLGDALAHGRTGDAAEAAVDVALSVATLVRVTPVGLLATAGWISYQGTTWLLEKTDFGRAFTNHLVDGYFEAEKAVRSSAEAASRFVSDTASNATRVIDSASKAVKDTVGSVSHFVDSVIWRPAWLR